MATVDLIPAPAGDAVAFRLTRWRMWRGLMLVMMPSLLLVRAVMVLVAAVVTGHPPEPSDLVDVGLSAAAGGVGAGVGALAAARGRLAWVRASAAGLELAATRHAPVFLPWSAVRDVRLRFRGPFTELVVTPTDPAAVAVAPGPGRRPRIRRRAAAPALVVDVGMMTPGPARLLAEVHRRLAAGR